MATLEQIPFKSNDGREFVFRHIESTDAPELLKFRAQIPHESTHTMQYVGMPFFNEEEMAKRLQAQAESKSQLNIGVFESKKIVGHLNSRVAWDNHPWVQHMAEFGMMVLKDYWGCGIGKKLLELQDEFAKQAGIVRLEAKVRTLNDRGIRLYQRHGYKIEGVRKSAALINGQLQDEYFIAKILNDPNLNWQPPVLKTKRFVLRPLTLADAEAIFSYAKNSNVSKYTLWEAHKTVKDSLDFITDYAFNMYRKKTPEPFGIAFKENPEKIIGTVGCFWVSQEAKSMELGYALAEEYWGQGIMTEVAATVVDYCFKEFSLKRIQSRCKAEHNGSRRVMEKIGMTYEGTLKAQVYHRQQYWDMHYYSLIKD